MTDRASPAAPEVSEAAARFARRVVTPIEAFLHVEAASGGVLLLVAAAAMFVANSSFADLYERILHTPIGARAGPLAFEQPLHFWINDGLMTIFFFVVGLEIRREMHDGELSSPRRAALPAAAAIGGMVAPALLYLAIAGRRAPEGWGVPMATDIAFAVGVLALLGKRVPPALRVLLLALAIIDDIGSILVIAFFYSGPLVLSGFAMSIAGVLGILLMQRIGVRRASLYVVPSVVVWLGLLRSGVHPTIGGVIVGLLTPARAWFGPQGLVETARAAAGRVEVELETGEIGVIPSERLAHEASVIDRAQREALAPAERLQILLHPWVAFGIMPIFALANAGVRLDAGAASPGAIGWGITAGLVVGKPLGIVGVSLLSVRARVAILPRGIALRELTVLGIVAGVGFTMAIFVAALAFREPAELNAAKTAILFASGVALVLGLAAGRLLLRPGSVRHEGAAATASEAETSDEL